MQHAEIGNMRRAIEDANECKKRETVPDQSAESDCEHDH